MLYDKNSFNHYFTEDILTNSKGVYRPATRKKRSGTFLAGIAKRVNKLRITLRRKKLSQPPKPLNESKNNSINNVLMSYDYNNIFLCSDTHFFKSEQRHNISSKEFLIKFKKDCDNVLKENGILIFLGDLSYKKNTPEYNEKVKEYMKTIKCKKILVKGNHDLLSDIYYRQRGFSYVLDELYLDDIIFTHKPVDISKYSLENVKYNIHGHLHGTNEYWNCDGKNHFDVWSKDNKFFRLNEIIRFLKERR